VYLHYYVSCIRLEVRDYTQTTLYLDSLDGSTSNVWLQCKDKFTLQIGLLSQCRPLK